MSIITIPQHNPEVVPLPKAFQAPPEAMHPGQIDYASFGDNAALKRASDALQHGWNEALAINELRANPHDEDRAATHDRKVRERHDGSARSFAEKFDNANAELKAELRAVEAELDRKAGLKPNMTVANLTVGTLQGMKNDGERMAAVSELLEDGDYETLATLMAVPRFTTQLPAAFLNGLRERVLHKVDPQGVKLRDHLKVAIEKMDNAATASIIMFSQLRAGTGQGEWKERAKQAAVDAERNRLANKR